MRYCLGLGVEADVAKARALFSSAADQDDALGKIPSNGWVEIIGQQQVSMGWDI